MGSPPPEFARWRDALRRMRPTYYRLVVDWAGIATPDGRGVDLAKPQHGCMREIPPCAGWAGVREQLQALAAAQAADPGRWQAMVVITGTPAALAREPAGCERAGTEPRSRAPRRAGATAYRGLISRLLAEARAAGAELRYWSPWNEPNHPYFLSPQRAACSAGAASAATVHYARLARAMKQTLDAEPGEQRLVLGETAGLLEVKPSYLSVGEFIRGLPRDLVCAAGIYGQHGYVGGPDPVGEAARALRSFRCPRSHEIWMTETGAPEGRACRLMRKRLKRWYEDPRVTAAFQYTLREDDRFPTGLVTVDLARRYPALAEWVAWGRRDPADPPPESRC